MLYRIARFPVTLSEAEGHFCCFKSCLSHLLLHTGWRKSLFIGNYESKSAWFPEFIRVHLEIQQYICQVVITDHNTP